MIEPIPARPLLRRLPLRIDELDFDRFKRFCLDFAARLPGVARAHRYGGTGSKQKGIDIVCEQRDSKTFTIQCRHVSRFGVKAAETTIAETTFKADGHVIAITRTASPDLRDFFRRRRKWELWDIGDISQKVRGLPREDGRRVVETTFGVRIRQDFLGGAPFPLYQTSDEFLALALRTVSNDGCSNITPRFSMQEAS